MGGEEVGSLYYNLDIDDKNLKGKLDAADKQVSSFGDRINKAWGKSVDASKQFAIGLGVVGAAAVGFGYVSVKAFEESQLMIAQTNAVLKSTGGIAGVTATQVDELSKALQRQTRFSDEDVRSAQNLLLTFTSIGKDIFPQATKTVLDMSTALGQDTKSSAIQLGKALQDPILGVTALRRVGVNFSEDQQKVIKNLVETGQKAKAQQMILKELNTEFGGSAEAAGKTFAGAMDRLKNSFNDFQEQVGEAIVNGLTPFVNGLLDLYDKAGGAEGIMKSLSAAFATVMQYLPQIAGFILGALTPAIVAFGIAAVTAVSGFIVALGPWALAGVAIATLIQLLVRHWTGFMQVVNNVRKALSAVGEAIRPVVEFVGGQLSSVFQSLTSIAKQLFDALRPVFEYLKTFFNQNKEVIMTVLKAVGAALAIIVAGPIIAGFLLLVASLKVLAVVLDFVAKNFDTIKNVFMVIMAVVFGPLVAIIWVIIQTFKLLWNLLQAGYNIVATVFSGIWTVISTVFGAIAAVYNAVLKPVFDAIGFLLHALFSIWWSIFSAIAQITWTIISTIAQIIFVIFQGIFNFVVDTILRPLANVIGAIFSGIYNVIAGLLNAYFNIVSSVFRGIYNVIAGIVNGIINVVRSVMNAVGGAISGPINGALNWLRGAAGSFVSAGSAIITGIVNGIAGGAGAVVNKVKQIAASALNAVKSFFGIKSPSTVMALQGRYLMDGLRKGIENTTAGVVNAATNASAAVLGGFNGSALGGTIAVNGQGKTAAIQTNSSNVQKGDTNVFIDKIEDRQDADYLLREFDRRQELEFMGGTPA